MRKNVRRVITSKKKLCFIIIVNIVLELLLCKINPFDTFYTLDLCYFINQYYYAKSMFSAPFVYSILLRFSSRREPLEIFLTNSRFAGLYAASTSSESAAAIGAREWKCRQWGQRERASPLRAVAVTRRLSCHEPGTGRLSTLSSLCLRTLCSHRRTRRQGAFEISTDD